MKMVTNMIDNFIDAYIIDKLKTARQTSKIFKDMNQHL